MTYSKTNPFLATLKDRYSLCKPGSKKNTQHLVLDLKGSDFHYNVGDSIAIYPTNDPELVEKTLKALKATGTELIHDKEGKTWILREFLTHKANITDFSRKFLTELLTLEANPEKKKRLEYLMSDEGKEALKEFLASHEIWDLLEMHPTVHHSIEEWCKLMMPQLPRFYSIASSQKAVGDEVHLTVALLRYEAGGHPRLGVCTHYLCNLVPFNQPVVPLYINPHHGFTLPEDDNANIIMIGPGTGVAPFRSFMQEREARGAKGKNWLFFGEWTQANDFFYEEEWKHWQEEGLLRIDTAFSRDQENKIYVQNRMMEHADELYEWIKNGAYVYVCGDAHRMAKDVDATLQEIIGKHTDPKAFMKDLRAQKRYLRDVY